MSGRWSLSPISRRFRASMTSNNPSVSISRFIGDLETPVSVFLKLGKGRDNAFLFESVQGGETRGRYSVIGIQPDLIWRCRDGKAEINRQAQTKPDDFRAEAEFDRPLQSLRNLLNEIGMDIPAASAAHGCRMFGYLGYDMVRHIENLGPAPPDPLDLPDAILIRPTITAIFDNVRDEIISGHARMAR